MQARVDELIAQGFAVADAERIVGTIADNSDLTNAGMTELQKG